MFAILLFVIIFVALCLATAKPVIGEADLLDKNGNPCRGAAKRSRINRLIREGYRLPASLA